MPICRVCAEKMEVGVNFVPETPNLDRVVEMSALTQALLKAFPDLTPDQYPWPNTRDGGGLGSGQGQVRGEWAVPPKTRTSASAAQQALDRIRQATLPSRPASASSKQCDGYEQQVLALDCQLCFNMHRKEDCPRHSPEAARQRL